MKEFKIEICNDGLRLDKFMSKVMQNASMSEIYKSLRKKKVRVNGKHKDGSYKISVGDTISMYINDEFFEKKDVAYTWTSASVDIDIVYQDENIIVVNKPSGMFSQDSKTSNDSLESRIRSYLYHKSEIDLNATPIFIPTLCHRIDRNTSGIVIAAKNSSALRILNEKIKNREIRKFYLCETEVAPQPQSGEISGYLVKDEKNHKMVFSDKEKPGSTPCKTIYKTLHSGCPSKVEVELLTGKTHQIRASFSHIGCPLVGDVKYGAKKTIAKDFQHLISYKIIFDFKTDAGILNYLSGTSCRLPSEI